MSGLIPAQPEATMASLQSAHERDESCALCCDCCNPEVSQRTAIRVLGVLCFILSVTQFGVAGSIAAYLKGYGFWWAAIPGFICGVASIVSKTRGWVWASFFLSVASLAIATFGAWWEGWNYAYYRDAGFTTCVGAHNQITGNAHFAANATECKSWQSHMPTYYYVDSFPENTCFCYNQYYYCMWPEILTEGHTDCGILFTKLPSMFAASSGVLATVAGLSIIVLVFSSVNICRCCYSQAPSVVVLPLPNADNDVGSNHTHTHQGGSGGVRDVMVQLPDGSTAMVPLADVLRAAAEAAAARGNFSASSSSSSSSASSHSHLNRADDDDAIELSTPSNLGAAYVVVDDSDHQA